MSNEAASIPSRMYVSTSPSGSRAAMRLPTSLLGGVFSATVNVSAPLENAGFLFATSGFGDPVPERDQSLWTSSLSARTCTS